MFKFNKCNKLMTYDLFHGFNENVLYKVITRLLYIVQSVSFQIGTYTVIR